MTLNDAKGEKKLRDEQKEKNVWRGATGKGRDYYCGNCTQVMRLPCLQYYNNNIMNDDCNKCTNSTALFYSLSIPMNQTFFLQAEKKVWFTKPNPFLTPIVVMNFLNPFHSPDHLPQGCIRTYN